MQHKIIINEKYFLFDKKFFLNFQKMVSIFENCKQFFKFKHLILKLTGHAKTCQDLTGTRP